MYNTVYADIMYNEDQKNEFMETLTESVAKQAKILFKKSSGTEEQLNKDLANFNTNDLDNLLNSFGFTTQASANASLTVIRQYILWATKKGYRSNNISPFDDMPADYIKKYVKPNFDKFLSKQQYFEIVDNLYNAQDKAFMILIWYGVNGKGYQEISNLKIEDIDFENWIIRVPDVCGNPRNIYIEEEHAKILEEAAKQTEYYKANGEYSELASRGKETADLIETGYLIKPSDTNLKEIGAVSNGVLLNKIKLLKTYFPELRYVTLKSLQASRFIYDGYELYKKRGKLGKEELIEILKMHGIKPRVHNRYETWYFGKVKNVTIETIKKLYPDVE